MRDGYLRGGLSPQPTQRQMDVLAAYVSAGGSVTDAARLVGIRPGTVKRHLADLRARLVAPVYRRLELTGQRPHTMATWCRVELAPGAELVDNSLVQRPDPE
jgi:predicted ArsR family transcriptional regulator